MKNKIFKTSEIIIYGIVLFILMVTLFFSAQIELLLKLKPDTSKIINNSLNVHFVDVGQGDAILIKYPNNKTMLIDSGAVGAEERLISYINNVFFANSTHKVFDYVMLTHSDLDHAGNMLTILNNYKVKNFIRPNILVNGLEDSEDVCLKTNDENYAQIIIKLNRLDINTITASQDLKIVDGIYEYIHILSPVKSYYNDENCYSPIVKIAYNNVSFLLTGDATTENEQEVINNFNSSVLDCDILKLGHHGSNSSTGYNFLESVSPKAVVVSAGKNNSYLHPSAEVINRIARYSEEHGVDLDSNIYETQLLGNIIFSVNGSNSYLVSNINNVNSYVFVPYWAVILLVVLLFIFGVIIPKLWKSLKKGK